MNRAAVAGLVVLVLGAVAAPASADRDDDDALLAARVVFARAGALWKTDGKGKGPAEELAKLPDGVTAADVRTLRTDAAGKVLLADLGGRWHWMPLDGSTTALTALACATDGPAALAPDAACVICANDQGQVKVVALGKGKPFELAVPAAGAAMVGTGKDRALIWSDGGIWRAPPGKLAKKQQLAPESPVRSLSISPDGTRALGVFAGEVFTSKKKTTEPADILYQFALDGTAARRMTIRDGVPLMWSHDGNWVLIQDGAKACIARGVGGEYKCWKGYTAVSLAPDASWALVLGPRKGTKDKDAKSKDTKGKDTKSKDTKSKDTKRRSGDGDEGSDDDDDDSSSDSTTSPTGPLSLYRAELAGAFTDPPILLETIVDGPAVWLP